MKRHFFVISILGLLGLVSACAPLPPNSEFRPLAQLDGIATGTMQSQPAVVELDGQPALLYAGKDKRVVFQHGKNRQTLDEKAPVKGGNRFQLNRQDQALSALWWSHQDGKNLYFTTSEVSKLNFSPISKVSDDQGVLGPFSVLQGTNGVVGITYLDERQPRFQAYFNRSTDYGKTWQQPDVRLDLPLANEGKATFVQEPQSVKTGDIWYAVWVDKVYVAGTTSYRIIGISSADEGKTWSTPKVHYSSAKLISSLAIAAQGAHVLVVADDYGRGVVAFASTDSGSSWKDVGVLDGSSSQANTAIDNNSGIGLVVSEGFAHLVWMQQRKNEPLSIMRGSVNMDQAQWTAAAQRVDTKPVYNTRSFQPVLLAAPKGQIVAAWVDYRDIRPNIYLSASFDKGISWSAPQALLQGGEVSVGQPRLFPWGNEVAVSYEAYPNDRPNEGNFVLKYIALGDATVPLPGLTTKATATDADRSQRLATRVHALWKHRLAGNYEAAYEVFDYAYKAANPLKNYSEYAGAITYKTYSVGEISITGNEAMVKVDTEYEVAPLMLPSGQPLKTASTKTTIDSKWVWVGKDWYLVYAPAFGSPSLDY